MELMESYKIAQSMGIANGIAEGLGVLILKMCVVLGLFYGGSLVHNNELTGGILVSYVFIALQVLFVLFLCLFYVSFVSLLCPFCVPFVSII